MNIQALVFDGFDELDLIGVYEPLRMAGFNIQLKSLKEKSLIKTAYGMQIYPDGIFNLANKPDVLLVPGGGWLSHAKEGAWAEAKDGTILQILKSCHQAGVILATVCTGAFLLAKAGLLEGRIVTTNHSARQELSEEGIKVIVARVVDDGNIITAGGITSSLDLGLYLVQRFCSENKANEISEKLEFEQRGPIWKAGDFVK